MNVEVYHLLGDAGAQGPCLYIDQQDHNRQATVFQQKRMRTMNSFDIPDGLVLCGARTRYLADGMVNISSARQPVLI